MLRFVNQTLVAWVMRKFKRFKSHKVRASQFLQRLATELKALFVHRNIGMTDSRPVLREARRAIPRAYSPRGRKCANRKQDSAALSVTSRMEKIWIRLGLGTLGQRHVPPAGFVEHKLVTPGTVKHYYPNDSLTQTPVPASH